MDHDILGFPFFCCEVLMFWKLCFYKRKNDFDEILIFFPDPWPKRKHNKRRLISENFLYDIKKVLKNDGLLIIKTDWKDYAKEIEQNVKKTFGRYKKFLDKKSNLTTKYEKIALKENRQITYFETYWAPPASLMLILFCDLLSFSSQMKFRPW